MIGPEKPKRRRRLRRRRRPDRARRRLRRRRHQERRRHRRRQRPAADTLELALKLDPCIGDTDGDGVEDGFEYQSALDLNNDDYQHANESLPYPGKTPYPNPLFADADVDYDGDGLTLAEEYKLWKYTYKVNHTRDAHADAAVLLRRRAVLALDARRRQRPPRADDDGRRLPRRRRRSAPGPTPTGYGTSRSQPRRRRTTRSTFDLYDMDRERRASRPCRPATSTHAEATYWDLDDDGCVSDDERDEDADGLTQLRRGARPDDRRLVGRVLHRRGRVPDRVRRHDGRTTPTATATASSTAPTTRTTTTSRTSWSSAATWPATRRSSGRLRAAPARRRRAGPARPA